MPVDFVTLLRRDHGDLQQELTQLLDPDASATELRAALDGVRLGLTAHAEAEDIVLAGLGGIPALATAIAATRAAHHAQEGALASLVRSSPQTPAWRSRAAHLRDLVACHAAEVDRQLAPALVLYTPPEVLARLAGAFATERLRQLSMLQPSAPLRIPGYARSLR